MSNTKTPDQVDVRGPRFAAWVTTVVLVVTLIVSGISTLAAAIILGVQAVVFAIGAVAGPRRHPYGLVFAKMVAPRLGPVREREPVPPLKFAQLVGLIFAVSAVAGFASGASLLGVIATGGGAGRRIPQRSLRHLPGLPALPARGAPEAGPQHPS